MFIKNFPQDHPNVIKLINQIASTLNIEKFSVAVFFGDINDPIFKGHPDNPNFVSIRLTDIERPMYFFDFQKFVQLQEILQLKINKFKIYSERRAVFWCEWI